MSNNASEEDEEEYEADFLPPSTRGSFFSYAAEPVTVVETSNIALDQQHVDQLRPTEARRLSYSQTLSTQLPSSSSSSISSTALPSTSHTLAGAGTPSASDQAVSYGGYRIIPSGSVSNSSGHANVLHAGPATTTGSPARRPSRWSVSQPAPPPPPAPAPVPGSTATSTHPTQASPTKPSSSSASHSSSSSGIHPTASIARTEPIEIPMRTMSSSTFSRAAHEGQQQAHAHGTSAYSATPSSSVPSSHQTNELLGDLQGGVSHGPHGGIPAVTPSMSTPSSPPTLLTSSDHVQPSHYAPVYSQLPQQSFDPRDTSRPPAIITTTPSTSSSSSSSSSSSQLARTSIDDKRRLSSPAQRAPPSHPQHALSSTTTTTTGTAAAVGNGNGGTLGVVEGATHLMLSSDLLRIISEDRNAIVPAIASGNNIRRESNSAGAHAADSGNATGPTSASSHALNHAQITDPSNPTFYAINGAPTTYPADYSDVGSHVPGSHVTSSSDDYVAASADEGAYGAENRADMSGYDGAITIGADGYPLGPQQYRNGRSLSDASSTVSYDEGNRVVLGSRIAWAAMLFATSSIAIFTLTPRLFMKTITAEDIVAHFIPPALSLAAQMFFGHRAITQDSLHDSASFAIVSLVTVFITIFDYATGGSAEDASPCNSANSLYPALARTMCIASLSIACVAEAFYFLIAPLVLSSMSWRWRFYLIVGADDTLRAYYSVWRKLNSMVNFHTLICCILLPICLFSMDIELTVSTIVVTAFAIEIAWTMMIRYATWYDSYAMYYLCWPTSLLFPGFQAYYISLLVKGYGHEASDTGHHWAQAILLQFFLLLSKMVILYLLPRMKRFFESGAKERLAQKLRNDQTSSVALVPLTILPRPLSYYLCRPFPRKCRKQPCFCLASCCCCECCAHCFPWLTAQGELNDMYQQDFGQAFIAADDDDDLDYRRSYAHMRHSSGGTYSSGHVFVPSVTASSTSSRVVHTSVVAAPTADVAKQSLQPSSSSLHDVMKPSSISGDSSHISGVGSAGDGTFAFTSAGNYPPSHSQMMPAHPSSPPPGSPASPRYSYVASDRLQRQSSSSSSSQSHHHQHNLHHHQGLSTPTKTTGGLGVRRVVLAKHGGGASAAVAGAGAGAVGAGAVAATGSSFHTGASSIIGQGSGSGVDPSSSRGVTPVTPTFIRN